MESVFFGMQFTNKELHYGQIGWGFALAMLQTLDFMKFKNTPVQVIEFRTELYTVDISPFTLLKSDSSREALLTILKNWKTHRKYFRWIQFSGQL